MPIWRYKLNSISDFYTFFSFMFSVCVFFGRELCKYLIKMFGKFWINQKKKLDFVLNVLFKFPATQRSLLEIYKFNRKSVFKTHKISLRTCFFTVTLCDYKLYSISAETIDFPSLFEHWKAGSWVFHYFLLPFPNFFLCKKFSTAILFQIMSL